MRPDINKMTRKEFMALPNTLWNVEYDKLTSVVILPGRRKHDSGFGIMSFVLLREEEIVGRTPECSDVLHIDGIGGFGKWRGGELPRLVAPVSWSLDLLWASKCLRLWARTKDGLISGSALSSFEVFATR